MTALEFYDSDLTRRAFLGKRSRDFSALVTEQAETVYREWGLEIPAAVSSTLIWLYRNGPASMSDVAAMLDHPHQTIAQHAAILTKLRLAKKRADANDGRRYEYHLTPRGRAQAARLEACLAAIADAYQSLFDEIAVDITQALERASSALAARPIAQRMPKPASAKMRARAKG